MRLPVTLKEAFTEPLNMAFLILVALAVVVSRGELLTMGMMAAAMEAAYLLFVSDSEWYRGVLRGRVDRGC